MIISFVMISFSKIRGRGYLHHTGATRKRQISDGKVDIAELYSQPRMAEMATVRAMEAGLSLELKCIVEYDGEPWNFTKAGKRARAIEKVKIDKPSMPVASPMCTAVC